MRVKVSSNDYAILEAFLAICGEDLLAKVDSTDKRDWTIVRRVNDKAKTIKALKTLNSRYADGELLDPHDVLTTYDDLVS